MYVECNDLSLEKTLSYDSVSSSEWCYNTQTGKVEMKMYCIESKIDMLAVKEMNEDDSNAVIFIYMENNIADNFLDLFSFFS